MSSLGNSASKFCKAHCKLSPHSLPQLQSFSFPHSQLSNRQHRPGSIHSRWHGEGSRVFPLDSQLRGFPKDTAQSLPTMWMSFDTKRYLLSLLSENFLTKATRLSDTSLQVKKIHSFCITKSLHTLSPFFAHTNFSSLCTTISTAVSPVLDVSFEAKRQLGPHTA